MPLYVDVNFANMVGPRLRNFKRRNEYLWNCSCPLCGDSKTNKSKARGYIYKVKTGLFYKCHNCGASISLGNLIKTVDPILYEEYVLQNYKEGIHQYTPHKKVDDAIPDIIKKPDLVDDILSTLTRMDELDVSHPAVKYLIKRKIPSKYWSLLYFCPRFKKYVNRVSPEPKFRSTDEDHPRLIIPYLNNHGKCFAFSGRAFGKEEPKYMTIKMDDTEEKVFGLDRVNYAKRIYVTEGPMDSLFIPNSIAVSGSSFDTPTVRSLMSNATLVYDNEPRSKELMKLMGKAIDAGYSVCIWPETIEYKDINEMVLNGMSPEDILDIINKNTYNGLEAKVKFSLWRKV